MSHRTEWTTAKHCEVLYDHHTDAYGTESDGRALLLSGDSTFAIEGTPEELREVLRRGLDALNERSESDAERATPDIDPEVVGDALLYIDRHGFGAHVDFDEQVLVAAAAYLEGRAESPGRRPVVFIGVEGGIADFTAAGEVDVVLLDWDNVRDDHEYAQMKLEEFREPEYRSFLDDHSWNFLVEHAQDPYGTHDER